MIQSVSEEHENEYIIYDAQLAGQISAAWFTPEYWAQQGHLQAVSAGRGEAWFIQAQHAQYVLRHYRRGGLMANLSADRYVWSGLLRTRAWREYLLLVELQHAGLPVPRPLAARVLRHGWLYTADLLTQRIPDSQPLSRILAERPLDNTLWQSLGKLIRAFHLRDVYHADLNAHNILLDSGNRLYLIDFDKSRIDQDTSWHNQNLHRLYRSLLKLQSQQKNFHFSAADWQAFLTGYSL